MATHPIIPFVIGNNGAWKFLRTSSKQGSCGVHGYPCYHPGVDVYGKAGTPVRAPESGQVVIAADGSAAPFVGYGPWLVMIKGASGRYHLLSHLAPGTASMAPAGVTVSEGQVIGTTSSANHTHWEVREKPTPGSGKTNLDNNVDPIAWMKAGSVIVLALAAFGGFWLYREWKKRR